jgi:xanthine phosphoribosyltransferase
MQQLVERIRLEALHLGQGMIKLDSLINHQLDSSLTLEMGQVFKSKLEGLGVVKISKVITVEVSGIAPALATAYAFGVPLVYARKNQPITMSANPYTASAVSRTKGGHVTLHLAREFLSAQDHVVLIDDFLASGKTILALAEIVQQSGATLLGIGGVVEKPYEAGRQRLEPLGVPIVSLACIEGVEGDQVRVGLGRSSQGASAATQ